VYPLLSFKPTKEAHPFALSGLLQLECLRFERGYSERDERGPSLKCSIAGASENEPLLLGEQGVVGGQEESQPRFLGSYKLDLKLLYAYRMVVLHVGFDLVVCGFLKQVLVVCGLIEEF
jgi:hypothetical protein